MMNRALITLAALAAAATLSACGGEAADTGATGAATDTASAATAVTEASNNAEGVTLEGATVRAKAAADAPEGTEMTAIFGTLHNNTDAEVTITGFTTSLGGGSNEIHEVVDGVMQQKEGGITIPAGSTHELAPGHDHMMVMDYTPEIAAGSTVDITLELANGTTVTVPDVAVRTMLPGHEDYGADGDLEGHQHGTEHNPQGHNH